MEATVTTPVTVATAAETITHKLCNSVKGQSG